MRTVPLKYDGENVTVTRDSAARLTGRHENVVRRYCRIIGYDERTKAALYDLAECSDTLETVPTRASQRS